jgi:hypothetical protein
MGGSYIAALVAFFLLIAGSVIVSGLRGAEFSAFSDILFGRGDATVLKTALAWGWVALGLAAVAGSFLSFISEEDDDPRVQRRRIPVGAPLLALVASFGLLWVIFAPRETPYVASAEALVEELAETGDIEDELAGGAEEIEVAALDPIEAEPPADPVSPAEPTLPEPVVETPPAEVERIIEIAKPLTASEETGFYWTYEFPLIRDGRMVSSPEVDRALAAFMPIEDRQGAVSKLLCGKAWVAFSGSASEEGPQDRNEMRARARAELVAARAETWLDAHPDCRRPVIVALDLGQHQRTDADDPSATAYQRQLIVIGRARASEDERIDAPAAVEEMRVFYANEAMRAKLLGARHFRGEAAVFVPGSGF